MEWAQGDFDRKEIHLYFKTLSMLLFHSAATTTPKESWHFGRRHSHIDRARRWERRPEWLPHGCPEYPHWWRGLAGGSPPLWSSGLETNKDTEEEEKGQTLKTLPCEVEMTRIWNLKKEEASSCLTLQHLVVDSLFTGDDQVKSVLAVLKALRLGFNSLIAVQHVQDAILCVSEGARSRNTSAETFKVKTDTKRISTGTTK